MDQESNLPISREKYIIGERMIIEYMQELGDEDVDEDEAEEELQKRARLRGISEDELDTIMEIMEMSHGKKFLTNPITGQFVRETCDSETITELAVTGKEVIGRLQSEDAKLTIGRTLRAMRTEPPPISLWNRFIGWLKRKTSD